MPCRLAMLESVVSLAPEQTATEALEILKHHNIRSAPVLESDGTYIGVFSLHSVFHSLLPIAVTMEGGLDQLDFVIGATPGVAKRLKKTGAKPVKECLDEETQTVTPETSLWEGVRIIVRHGSPVPVVREDGKFAGLMTEQSCLATLQSLQEDATSHPQGHLSEDDIKLLKESGVL
jgi:CBS domain-containing protein